MVNLGELFDNSLTREEWWAEFDANACCDSVHTAARRLCGCGGSAAFNYPEASRLLTGVQR